MNYWILAWFACGLISYFWLRHIFQATGTWTRGDRILGFMTIICGPTSLALLLIAHLLFGVDWDKEAKW